MFLCLTLSLLRLQAYLCVLGICLLHLSLSSLLSKEHSRPKETKCQVKMIESLNLHTCFSPLPISSALFILYFQQGHIECIMIIFTPNYPQVSPFLASEPHYPSHLVATPLEKMATLPPGSIGKHQFLKQGGDLIDSPMKGSWRSQSSTGIHGGCVFMATSSVSYVNDSIS